MINNIYDKNSKQFQKNLQKYQKSWTKFENKFLELTKQIFPTKYWPNGKYTAYLTVWGMFPRDIKKCTFQIPAFRSKANFVNSIIAHELLHFIFYSYCYKTYPKFKQPNYNSRLWHASEIFNIVVQCSKPWMKIFQIKPKYYPEHKDIIHKTLKQHPVVSREDVDELITKLMDVSKLLK